MIVVDASALIEILLTSERSERIWKRLFAREESLHAPHLLDIEIAQVMRRYVARGEVTAERGRATIDLLPRIPVHRYPHEPLLPRIWALKDNSTTYDAAYLALAEALNASLVTCDHSLERVPGVRAQVEVF